MKAFLLSGLVLSLFALQVCCLDSLIIGTFGGAGIVDQFAINKGYFTEKNLAPTFAFVSGSDQQFLNLDNGVYDLVSTAGDNTLYRRLNQGRSEYITLAEYDGSPALQMLVNQNLGLHDLADVVGKVILTDSTQSGFITALSEFFFKANLGPLNEADLVPSGGLLNRINFVIDGTSNGTMSEGGTTIVSLAKNPQLISVGELEPLVCPYIGGQLVALESWLQKPTNANKIVRFLRAELQGLVYVTNPANKAEVISFIESSNGVDATTAEIIFDKTIASQNVGFNRFLVPRQRGTINGINMRVNDLRITRAACLPLSVELISRPGGWFDLSFLNTAAIQELGFFDVFGLFYNYPLAPCEVHH